MSITRPDSLLPKSRAGGQGDWFRTFDNIHITIVFIHESVKNQSMARRGECDEFKGWCCLWDEWKSCFCLKCFRSSVSGLVTLTRCQLQCLLEWSWMEDSYESLIKHDVSLHLVVNPRLRNGFISWTWPLALVRFSLKPWHRKRVHWSPWRHPVRKMRQCQHFAFLLIDSLISS